MLKAEGDGGESDDVIPNPFSRPNIFNGFKSLSALKKQEIKVSFTSYDLLKFRFVKIPISLTDRMRQLDKLHFHSPIESECNELNIPNNRINLHSMKEVLFLCGGAIGVRFCNEEFDFLRKLLLSLSTEWSNLEQEFKLIDNQLKKTLCMIFIEDDKPTISCTKENEIIGEDQLNIILTFHKNIDLYIDSICELQKFVISKHETIDRSADKSRDFTKLDVDPESHIGKKWPDWLNELINKYNNFVTENNNNKEQNNIDSNPNKITVGKLSVFLSECVLKRITCNQVELSALHELIQASNDHEACFADSHNNNHFSSQKYWAQRLFNFLSKMTELRSMIKDEKAIIEVKS
eukprot:gene8803-11885_t